MSRRIETGTTTPTLGANDKPDDYLGRLVGYIPAEIVALYLTANGVVPETEANRLTVLWIIFAACGILTPIYFYFTTQDKGQGKGPLWVQLLLATVAFPVWVFALGGPFLYLAWYKAYLASLLLFFVTVIFGMIKPRVGS